MKANTEVITYPDQHRPPINTPIRYRVSLKILSFQDGGHNQETSSRDLQTSLFVVKGNPLIISPCPLPCFSSGIDQFVIEVRPNDGIENLYVQAIINNLSAHMALPLDEILECSGSGIERSITMWDTQTGNMSGTSLIEIRAEKEIPHSYPEILAIRKGGPRTQTQSTPTPTVISAQALLSQQTDFVASSRATLTGQVESMQSERDALVDLSRRLSMLSINSVITDKVVVPRTPESPGRRRKRGGVQGFAVADTSNIFDQVIQD